MAPPTIDQVLQHFSTAHSLHIRPTFLSGLLASLNTQRQVPAGPALFATLKFRVLASDITESLQPHANLCFPVTATSADVQAATLPGPVAVQVVGLEDMGTSRIQQIERIEMGERGEIVKGREVIRVVPTQDESGEGAGGSGGAGGAGGTEGRRAGQPTGKEGPYKVLVEDAGGRRVYGIELKSVPGIKSDMPMGTKVFPSLSLYRWKRGGLGRTFHTDS